MTKLNRRLLILLAAQLCLLLVATLTHSRAARGTKLLFPGLAADAITSLRVLPRSITGQKDGVPTMMEGPEVLLTKRGAAWSATSHFNQPVDASKVEALIAALRDAEASAPLTSDVARHAELRVADLQYDRKLTITAGSRTYTLLIGLTTGQTAAIRLAGQAEVYESTRISPWSVAGDAAGWMQKTYAQVAPVDLQAIEVTNLDGTWRLDRRSGDWALWLAGAPVLAPAGAQLDGDLIRQLPNAAASFIAVAPADPNAKPAPEAQKAVVRVFAANQPTATYDVFSVGRRFWVRAQGRADAVLVEGAELATLAGLSLQSVLRHP